MEADPSQDPELLVQAERQVGGRPVFEIERNGGALLFRIPGSVNDCLWNGQESLNELSGQVSFMDPNFLKSDSHDIFKPGPKSG